MVDEREWLHWRAQELRRLGELIDWAGGVFSTSEEKIEGSRLYGTALLVHGVDCACAIRLCLRKDLPSPAFALARTLYEGVLRGHIILHEIDLEELNEFLRHTGEWRERSSLKQSPPSIQLEGKGWKCFGKSHIFKTEIAKLWQESILDMGLLHDLTHAGMTQALQMVDSNGTLGGHHSVANQTLLLSFAQRAVMFTAMTWPGAMQKFGREIEQRVQKSNQRKSTWERHIQTAQR